MNIVFPLPGAARTILSATLLACATLAGYGVCRAEPAEVPFVTEIDALATDREFASRALDVGMRAAYDRYLADDAVLFRPLPVRGREWLETHEPATGRLEWTPSVAETACDSSIAVTLGAWTYTARDSKSPESGQYLTVWRRSAAGDWRIVLDQSVSLAAMPPAKPAVVDTSSCVERADGARKLLAAERKQNAAMRTLRAGDAVAIPVKAGTSGTVQGANRADLAVTHGELQDRRGGAPEVRAVYVRVWQRDGRSWRVLHEFVTPVAP